MTTDKEFFNVKYKEGSLDPKAAQLILFAVNIAIGHEHGAKLHLGRARELGASEDEIWETVVYAMRPVAANVRNFAKAIIEINDATHRTVGTTETLERLKSLARVPIVQNVPRFSNLGR